MTKKREHHQPSRFDQTHNFRCQISWLTEAKKWLEFQAFFLAGLPEKRIQTPMAQDRST
jgi:hypothetical protein